MDIKSTATYYYPIWGVNDDFKGEYPSGDKKIHKDYEEGVFVIDYTVNTHNEGIDRLISEGLAAYLCIVQCPTTFYTQIEQSQESTFSVKVPCNYVNKRFTVKIEIVAVKPIVGCDYLDVDDFWNVVDYDKGAMISLIDKFSVPLTPTDDVANLSRIVKYEFCERKDVFTDLSESIILIKLPYSYEDAVNYAIGQCPNIFEGTYVRNALIEAVYELRSCYEEGDSREWVFYIKQFVDKLVSEDVIEENDEYAFELSEVMKIVDKLLPDVMINALEDVKNKIELTQID